MIASIPRASLLAPLTASALALLAAAPPAPTPTPAPEPWRLFVQDVAWAPDGARFAFSRYAAAGPFDARHWAVWVAERDGSRPRKVVSGALYASFSPDGRRLAVGLRFDDDWEIATVALDGSDVRRLTRRPGRDSAPAWSPDGRTLVYSAEAGDTEDLWAIDADGASPRRLTDDPAADYNPAFSADGKRVVFYREEGDRRDQVWLLELATGREARLTDGMGHYVFPSFLPDGRVAFAALGEEGRRSRLMVTSAPPGAAAIGGAPHPFGPEGIFFARWSPDAREVLFLAQGGREVRSMPAAGGEPRTLVDLAALEDR